ncbi:MAG: hypothetical protein ACRDG3_13660 [Tepidiformaceae bacterium]
MITRKVGRHPLAALAGLVGFVAVIAVVSLFATHSWTSSAADPTGPKTLCTMHTGVVENGQDQGAAQAPGVGEDAAAFATAKRSSESDLAKGESWVQAGCPKGVDGGVLIPQLYNNFLTGKGSSTIVSVRGKP